MIFTGDRSDSRSSDDYGLGYVLRNAANGGLAPTIIVFQHSYPGPSTQACCFACFRVLDGLDSRGSEDLDRESSRTSPAANYLGEG